MDNQDLEMQAQSSPEVAETGTTDVMNVGERLSKRNFFMFPLGTFGRDFLYNFFNGFLLTFVLLTKHLSDAQFAMITVIIVCARIFDAFNDPIMGSIVENTRTKWGKYKPWQLIGAILTGGVIIALFNVPLYGWSFIGFLAFAYFMFSITFTMNDISYWGMMPSLTSNPDDRNKLTSFTQLVCSAGGGLAGLLVPLLTVGDVAHALHLDPTKGYGLISIVVVVLMVGFQLFTILGVKEKPLPADFQKTQGTKLKDLFKVLFHNDQLLWCTLVMLIWNLISGIAVGNILTFYIYFEFGYEGMLGTVFSIVYAILSVVFTLFYPWFSKKLGRNRTLYSCGITLIISYALLLIVGLVWPNNVGGGFVIPILNLPITPKFLVMALLYGFTGWSTGFYMIMLINMANTVEYNEWKTGKRDEAVIFSLRPFTAKMGSALSQGLISLVLLITGSLLYTNQISDLENQGTEGLKTGEEVIAGIKEVIAGMDEKTKMGLLACMCVIPMVLMAIALIIYKAKCKLDEPTLAKMIEETEARKAAAQETSDEELYEEAAAEVDGVVTTEEEPAAPLLVGEEADEKIEELAEEETADIVEEEADEIEEEPVPETEEEPETPAEEPSEQPEEVPEDEDTVPETSDEQEQQPAEEVSEPAEDDVPEDSEATENVDTEDVETEEEAPTDETLADEVEGHETEEPSSEEPETAEETVSDENVASDVEDDEDEDDSDDEDDAADDTPAADDGAPRYILTYLAKLIQAPDEVKAYYSAVKNIFLSYRGVDTRVTRAHESIFIGRVKLAKFVMRGKTLELQLALTTRDINKSKYAIEKIEKNKSDYTCRYKLNGVRRVQYVGELIKMLMKSKGVELATRHKDRDFAAELPYEEIETLVEKGLAKVKK